MLLSYWQECARVLVPSGNDQGPETELCVLPGTPEGRTKAAVSPPPTHWVFVGFLCCPPQRLGRNVQPRQNASSVHPPPPPPRSPLWGGRCLRSVLNEVEGRAGSSQPPAGKKSRTPPPLPNCRSQGEVPEASRPEAQSLDPAARLTEFPSATHCVTLVKLL